MTIQFHVDNLKLSHMDQSIINNVVKQLNDVFCTSKKELTKTKGPIYNFFVLLANLAKRIKLCLPCMIILKILLAPLHQTPDPARAGLFTVDESLLLLLNAD